MATMMTIFRGTVAELVNAKLPTSQRMLLTLLGHRDGCSVGWWPARGPICTLPVVRRGVQMKFHVHYGCVMYDLQNGTCTVKPTEDGPEISVDGVLDETDMADLGAVHEEAMKIFPELEPQFERTFIRVGGDRKSLELAVEALRLPNKTVITVCEGFVDVEAKGKTRSFDLTKLNDIEGLLQDVADINPDMELFQIKIDKGDEDE